MSESAREQDIRAEDTRHYWQYTGPQRLDKALHTLDGLLKGVAADREISTKELKGVKQWMGDHAEVAHLHPFNEIIPFLEDVLADGVIDKEEARDVLWLCDRLSTPNDYFAAATSDIQRLQGMLGGVAADGTITEEELESLSEWMDEHEGLKGCWPFDELESVILGVLKDGRIDPDEHRLLLALFAEFVEVGGHRAVDLPINEMVAPITGFCAVCPDVTFAGKLFAFTGRSVRSTRRKLAELIERFGGTFKPSVTRDLDYLIIGAEGNASWAFACYGRKVEQAMEYRKQGLSVVLVHEHDFWDAVADAES